VLLRLQLLVAASLRKRVLLEKTLLSCWMVGFFYDAYKKVDGMSFTLGSKLCQ
jgi:hypothetical protein